VRRNEKMVKSYNEEWRDTCIEDRKILLRLYFKIENKVDRLAVHNWKELPVRFKTYLGDIGRKELSSLVILSKKMNHWTIEVVR
jgi:hypothetical protein